MNVIWRPIGELHITPVLGLIIKAKILDEPEGCFTIVDIREYDCNRVEVKLKSNRSGKETWHDWFGLVKFGGLQI